MIRRCRPDELDTILEIVNAAAEVYRGVIPSDCWHEPYMSRQELESEIAAGVDFWGHESDTALLGIMGTQPVKDVTLIRHAYVRPGQQGRGIGGELLAHLRTLTTRPILIGTWAAADWAIRFYERHGFVLVPIADTPDVLRRYWTISDRQIETSVVLTMDSR